MKIPGILCRSGQRRDMADCLVVIEEWMSGDIEGTGLFTDERCKRGIDIGFAVSLEHKQLPSQGLRRCGNFGRLFFGDRVGKGRASTQISDRLCLCRKFGKKLDSFAGVLPAEDHACDVAARVGEARRKAELHRIRSESEHHRNGRGGGLCRQRRSGAPSDYDDGRFAADQIARQCRVSVEMLLGPTIFKHEVLAFDEARIPETCPDAIDCARISPGLVAVKEANNRHGRLLRARNQRPRGGRAANAGDEITPLHSVISPRSSIPLDSPSGQYL